MGRPRQHNEQTREALLIAAEQLIAHGGLDAVSTRAVAEQASATTRAVYSLFGSKQGLLHALAARGFLLLADRVQAVPVTADPGADLVNVAVCAFRGWALAHPNLFRVVFGLPDTDLRTVPAVGPASRAALGQLRNRIERASDAGLLGTRPIDEVVVEWHALGEGLASVELRGQMIAPEDAERMWRDTMTAFLRGLSTPHQPRDAPANGKGEAQLQASATT
jgi:AcrR family transcriptional regulator